MVHCKQVEDALMVESSIKNRLAEYGLVDKVNAATLLLKSLLPSLSVRTEEVEKLIGETFASGSDVYGEIKALRWAEGFEFPLDVTDRDRIEFEQLDYNLIDLVKRRQKEIGAKRMSLETISRISHQDPDYGLLEKLVEGLRIFVAADFVPNGKPPLLRK